MALCAAWVSAGSALADPPAPADLPRTTGSTDLDGQRQRLQGASDAAAKAEAAARRGEADLAVIRADRARLGSALIAATARVKEAENRAGDIEKRLDLLVGSEEAIRRSLASRRGEIAEILAALQRMGLKPLPAILASPADVLRAIRTSMLLTAVVPEVREAAEALASDLGDLTRLRASIVERRTALAGEIATLDAERARLATLIVARQRAQIAAEGAVDASRQRSADLAREATGLRDLVARLETEAAAARRAEEAARAAADERLRAAEADAADVAAKAATATRDVARLAPEIAFADAKGRLTLPVAGRMVKAFGASDDYGGQEHGSSIATRPGAIVTAPSDGWILFAGPYRSYGQLLILDGGGGYDVVLAGMERADVVAGQFVLAGEPVAVMGAGTVRTASSIALGAAGPVLYVEFRKDGTAIDPSPWWAKAELEKVRG